MELVDGGMFSNVSIGDPIERCREEGYNDEDIIIDILLCYEAPWVMEEWDSEKLIWENAYDFYERRKEISRFYYYTGEIQRLYRGYHDVNFRLVIQPSAKLTTSGALPIEATRKDLNRELDQGFKDGLAAVRKLMTASSDHYSNVDRETVKYIKDQN